MKTIDEQLEEALARITQLESDATASTSLLTESGHQHERFRQEIAALTKEKDALAASTAAEQITALSTEVETLKANAKSAERIAAERYGAASPQPLPVTPRGDVEAATLIEKFKAITDPAEQTAFWRSLSAEKRALILNAK